MRDTEVRADLGHAGGLGRRLITQPVVHGKRRDGLALRPPPRLRDVKQRHAVAAAGHGKADVGREIGAQKLPHAVGKALVQRDARYDHRGANAVLGSRASQLGPGGLGLGHHGGAREADRHLGQGHAAF